MNPFCTFNNNSHNFEDVSQTTRGIVLIDPRIDDYRTLRAGASPRLQVFILDPLQDGVVQISAILSDWIGLSCLYLVSHGTPGCLELGTARLNLETLDGYRRQLKYWTNALSDSGDILLCNPDVGQGERGLTFLQKLSQIVETNVITTADLTFDE